MNRRILVVEDNPPSRELLTDWLENEGYVVDAAVNLEQAFSALSNIRPSAVLLDIDVGSEDGLSLALWIRKNDALSLTPIIAVTAHALITDLERMKQAGCDVCVAKPVDFKVLRLELNRLLERPDDSPGSAGV